jgi:hypothetical protein
MDFGNWVRTAFGTLWLIVFGLGPGEASAHEFLKYTQETLTVKRTGIESDASQMVSWPGGSVHLTLAGVRSGGMMPGIGIEANSSSFVQLIAMETKGYTLPTDEVKIGSPAPSSLSVSGTTSTSRFTARLSDPGVECSQYAQYGHNLKCAIPGHEGFRWRIASGGDSNSAWSVNHPKEPKLIFFRSGPFEAYSWMAIQILDWTGHVTSNTVGGAMPVFQLDSVTIAVFHP